MPILSICQFEWSRLFLTRRGWLSISAFLLVWILILVTIIAPAARVVTSELGGLAAVALEAVGLDNLSSWPSVEMALYWVISLYLLPLFSITIAADQIASDKTRGTLRYLALRTTRSQIFFGRFLGQITIQILLVAATLLSVLLLVGYYSPDKLTGALQSTPVVFVNLLLVLMPYIALMALLSVIARSARQATLYAIVAWIVISIAIGVIQNRYGPLPMLDWVLPGSQIGNLLRLDGWDTLALAPIPLLHTAVLLFAGWLAMRRIDL